MVSVVVVLADVLVVCVAPVFAVHRAVLSKWDEILVVDVSCEECAGLQADREVLLRQGVTCCSTQVVVEGRLSEGGEAKVAVHAITVYLLA